MLPSLSFLLLRYHKSPASPIIETNPTGAKIINDQVPTSIGNLLQMNYLVGFKNGNLKTKGELT